MSGYDYTDLMELVAENKINQLYTCLPCKVKSFNKAEQKVEVDILVKLRRPYKTDGEEVFQSIAEVPVGFYNSDDGNCFMTFPIKTGDLGIVLFSTLDIDNYLSGDGTIVDSGSFARNQLKDAMFLPTFRPWKKALSGLADDDIIIKNNDTTFTFKNNGKLQISNTANELITVLDELITKLISATTITMLGASPFTASTVADLTAVQVKLQSFKV